MKLNFAVLESLVTLSGGIALNAHQLRLLGIAWPAERGWVHDLIGTEVSDDVFNLLVELRGSKKRQARNAILAKHGISARDLFQTPLHRWESIPSLSL